MSCLIVNPDIIRLHSEIKNETLSSIKNMIGIWQEREMASGNLDVTIDSMPDADTLRKLFEEFRREQDDLISLSKDDFNGLLDNNELPNQLVSLGEKLGVHISINKRKHTIKLVNNGSSANDMKLFKALAVELVYSEDDIAEKAFGMSPRERLQTIMDWERSNKKAKNRNNELMNYELQCAKRALRDSYGISDDGIMEAYRKQAAESFNSTERIERVAEITDWFDRILTETHQQHREDLSAQLDDIRKAIENKDKSKYYELAGMAESQDAKQRLLSTDLSSLGVSVRLYKFIKDKKIITVGDVVKYNKTVFSKTFNPSTQVLKELVSIINSLGLSFGMDTSNSPSVEWSVVESEYNRRIGEIQDKLNSITRIDTLKEITPQAIFDEIQKKFSDISSMPVSSDVDFINALHNAFPETSKNFIKKNISWYRDQVKKVVDNFPVLREEACRELELSEHVKINIYTNIASDMSFESKYENENSEGEEEADVNGVENQYKETWMYEYDTTSNFSKMSAQVRRVLYKCPLFLGGNKRRRTRFGSQYNVPVMEVINALIGEMQGVSNSREMELILEYMKQDFPWAEYILSQIKDNSQLKTQLFRSIRRYTQSLGILKKDPNNPTNFAMSKLNIVNSGNSVNSIMTAAKKQIASGFPINKKMSIYDDDSIDIESVDEAIGILEKYVDRDRYNNIVSDIFTAEPSEIPGLLSDNPELINDLHKVLTAMGFAITAPEIRIISAMDVRRNSRNIRNKNNIGILWSEAYSALRIIKDSEYESTYDLLNEPEQLSSENRAMVCYTAIAKVLTLADNGAVEPSIRENGKVRYSFVLPSFLDDLIVGLQGKKVSEDKSRAAGKRVNLTTREYIEKTFGEDPRYAYEENGEIHYRNYILEALAYGGSGISGSGISYVTILSADTAFKDKTEQKDLTQEDRLNILWSMYHQGESEYLNAQGTWYPIPLPSDSGRIGFIRFTDVGEDIRHNAIKEEILKELERMTDPSYSAYDEQKESINPVYSHVPLTLRMNKNKFCTFPVLNDAEIVSEYDSAALGKYSVSGIINMYIAANETGQFSDLNDLIDRLAYVVEDAAIKKFAEENPNFYKRAYDDDNIGPDVIDGFILDQCLFQMGINELLNGDPAYYTGYNTGSDNIQKRAKQFIVPLDHLDIFNEDFLEEYKNFHGIDQDDELGEDDIVEHVLYIDDPIIPSPSYDDIKMLYDYALENEMIDPDTYEAVLRGFRDIKYTDGQTFRLFKSMRMLKYALGEMKKGDELDKAFGRIESGTQQPGDVYVVQAAIKSFLSGPVKVTNPDGSVRMIYVQHKHAEQLLTALLVQASKTRLGKSNALVALAEIMEEEHVDAAIFTSGVKVGQNGSINFGDVDIESASKDEILDKMRDEIRRYREATGSSIIHRIPYSLWGIVAKNRDSGLDEDVPIAIQLQKLISADLPDQVKSKEFDGDKWVTKYEKAIYHVDGIGDMSRDEIVNLYNRLMTEKIMRAYKEVTGIFADKKQLSEALQRSCRNSSRNSAYLERAFSLNEYGDFVIPLCDLATLNMSSEFLNSIVKNSVSRISSPGKSLVAMSAFGMAKDLRIEFEYDENHRPIRYKAIQCLLPAWSRFIIEKCTDENGYIDINKLRSESPRLLDLIGMRIPLQFKNFILPLRVVDFLPPILGDSIVTAIDNIPLLDSDFDNDKIPVLFPSFSAQYMVDNWEDKAYEDYKKHTNKWYDFNKLHDDFVEYMNQRRHDGIEDLGYDFGDFIHERLDDSDYEQEYRKDDAPEGRPLSFSEFKKEHKSDYIRPDGPKLNYIQYNPYKTIESQSDEAIDNALISVMIGMLTSRAVSTMSLALGSPDKFDPIINKLDTISRKGKYSKFDGPADISTRVSQETKNNDGKQMIAVFANAEAMQAILQHTDVELISGMEATINGRALRSLHDVYIDNSTTTSLGKDKKSIPELISRILGTSIGASADNAKKPRLSKMNINLRTARVVSLMAQLGYSMDEIAFFLNIPSIRHYTDTGDFNGYRSDLDSDVVQVLPGDINNMANAIHEGDRDDLDEDILEYNKTALSVFLYLDSIGERLLKLSTLVRGDSGGTRPHGPLENNLVRLLNEELFEEEEAESPTFNNWKQVVRYSYEQEASEAEVLNAKNPIAQAYITYGVVGAFRMLEQYYPGIGNPDFRAVIKNIIKKYYNGVATVTNVKNIMYSLYNYIESSYDCMRKDDMSFEASRNYYLTEFPAEAAEIVSQHPEIANSILFRRLSLYSSIESDEDPFISLDYDGTMLPETRDAISATWQQLFYAKDSEGKPDLELRELALDLFKYCYFRNGFRFGSGTFAHMAPAEARLLFPGYAEMLNDMLDNLTIADKSKFEIQFVRNNLYYPRFCRTVPQGARVAKPDNWFVNNAPAANVTIPFRDKINESVLNRYEWYFQGSTDGNIPINAFLITTKGEGGKINYYYYVKVSDNDGYSTYALTTPLGWKDKAVEYSATEDGMTMLSAFDQSAVAQSIRNRGKKNRRKSNRTKAKKNRDYEDARRADSSSGNSSEEPNEQEDENETYKGFKTLYFTESGYKEALELYPEIAKSKKFKEARESWLKSKKTSKKSDNKKGKSAKSKRDIEKEKNGGNKSRDKFKIKQSSESLIINEEANCAREIGAYTICITDNESSQFGKKIREIAGDNKTVSVLFDPSNAYTITSQLLRKLNRKYSKSIVLNLTGSYMNTLDKYTTQEDVDAYVLKIYSALKSKGIFVSKVVTTAQPGVPLASARAAMKLGYTLEVHPTQDYKVAGKGKPVADKKAFLSNLGSSTVKKDNQIYDKEDGAFIVAKNEWTRAIASKDKRTIYVFRDTPERRSGFNRASASSAYVKKYSGGRIISYPDSGQDSIRSLENAFPISSEGRTDADIKEFRRILSGEINDIIDAMESGEYKRVVLPADGIFGDITKEKTPKLYKELTTQLEYLRDKIEEISDSQVNEDDNIEDSSNLKIDENDTLSSDEISPINVAEGRIYSNVYILDVKKLLSLGITVCNSSGDEVEDEKLFVVLDKDDKQLYSKSWERSKVYSSNGKRIIEDITFYMPSGTLTKELPSDASMGVSESLKLSTKVPYNKAGLTWLDDNNNPIC